MVLTLRPMLRDPLFRAGLVLRLALVVLLVPQIQLDWFVPFVEYAIAHPSLDPWSHFLPENWSPRSATRFRACPDRDRSSGDRAE